MELSNTRKSNDKADPVIDDVPVGKLVAPTFAKRTALWLRDFGMRWVKFVWSKNNWTTWRSFGNSQIVRLAALIPVVGYLILFNENILGYLKLQTGFCAGAQCDPSWRMYYFYFGLCSASVGLIIYIMYCPDTVKSHATAIDYYYKEREYYAHGQHAWHLYERSGELVGHDSQDRQLQIALQKVHSSSGSGELSVDPVLLSSVMRRLFYYHVHSRKVSCTIVGLFYIIGTAMMAIPTIYTFFDVVRAWLR